MCPPVAASLGVEIINNTNKKASGVLEAGKHLEKNTPVETVSVKMEEGVSQF